MSLRVVLVFIGCLGLCSIGGASLAESDAAIRGRDGKLSWGVEQMRVVAGSGTLQGDRLALRFNDAGNAIVEVAAGNIDLETTPYLRIVLGGEPAVDAMTLAWMTVQGGDKLSTRPVGSVRGQQLRLRMTGVGEWQGNLRSLGLILFGEPGQTVTVEGISLLPDTISNRLFTFFSNWTAFTPWDQSSVNFHSGARAAGLTPYPVPMVAAAAFLGMVFYVLWRRLILRERGVNFSAVAAIFLVAWISLDLVWQGKLLRQLAETSGDFAGLSDSAKRELGEDGELFRFTTQVQARLENSAARIFVSSTDDYTGMRGAYFLYPGNVFWQRRAAGLPGSNNFLAGDYIVLLHPAREQYSQAQGVLVLRDKRTVRVESLLSAPLGGLYRVM